MKCASRDYPGAYFLLQFRYFWNIYTFHCSLYFCIFSRTWKYNSCGVMGFIEVLNLVFDMCDMTTNYDQQKNWRCCEGVDEVIYFAY